MKSSLKKGTNPEQLTKDSQIVDVGSATDVEEVMKKYDKESNTRNWEGVPKTVVTVMSAAFSLYCMWSTLFSTALPEVRLNIFLGLILLLGYIHYPIKKGIAKVNYIPWYDILIMVVGSSVFFYFAFNADTILRLATRVTGEWYMVAIAIIGILAFMELCRRCVGIPILVVLSVLLIYTFSTVRFGKVIYDLFYTTNGIMGTPTSVAAKFIVVFIIFGAFLERTGISAFFIDLANSIAGASSGGPAKVAVISSALCGMVSGSSVGNTVTTGSVTIPMMIKTGYKPAFAGAVEAAASTGGQIMPPIMGAAAFLMAEYTGRPYAEIALKALLPALLYFTGIFIAVHLEARKLGLKGIPKNELPKMRNLLPKSYLLLPLIVLILMVSLNLKTMQFSATVAIGMTLIVGLINKENKITPAKILEALDAGGKSSVTVAVACAIAGLVAGCITSTGLASQLITLIVSISGGKAIIALFLTMLCCIILGMGVPTTANYTIMAATTAPIIMAPEIGVVPIAAHFFVFYFGIVADITPPVALAAYAGSAIAKSSPMRTAFNATKLAIAAFVVPYVFAYNPLMLFEFAADVAPWLVLVQVIQIVLTAVGGIFFISAALGGYLFTTIPALLRIVMIAAGLSMLIPSLLTDLIGLAVAALVIVYQRYAAKNKMAV